MRQSEHMYYLAYDATKIEQKGATTPNCTVFQALLNFSFLRLQRGQRQVSGRSSNLVPGGIPCLGSPNSGS